MRKIEKAFCHLNFEKDWLKGRPFKNEDIIKK